MVIEQPTIIACFGILLVVCELVQDVWFWEHFLCMQLGNKNVTASPMWFTFDGWSCYWLGDYALCNWNCGNETNALCCIVEGSASQASMWYVVS